MMKSVSMIKEEHPDWEWFYVTFGMNHIDPTTGLSLFERYVVVCALNMTVAREVVQRRIDNRYAFIYSNTEFMGQRERYGLSEWVWDWSDKELEIAERMTT